MIYVLDVDYNENESANVACIGFRNWDDKNESFKLTKKINNVAPYEAGSFYKRELPCLVEALDGLVDIEMIIVDGYVWLGDETNHGLGMYLYEHFDKKIPIIGVAKNKYNGTPEKCEICRGESKKALYVTSVGIDLNSAKNNIMNMYGKFRFPKLLKDVDSLCRGSYN